MNLGEQISQTLTQNSIPINSKKNLPNQNTSKTPFTTPKENKKIYSRSQYPNPGKGAVRFPPSPPTPIPSSCNSGIAGICLASAGLTTPFHFSARSGICTRSCHCKTASKSLQTFHVPKSGKGLSWPSRQT